MSPQPGASSAEFREDKDELVYIVVPPLFRPNGQQKERGVALERGDWIGF